MALLHHIFILSLFVQLCSLKWGFADIHPDKWLIFEAMAPPSGYISVLPRLVSVREPAVAPVVALNAADIFGNSASFCASYEFAINQHRKISSNDTTFSEISFQTITHTWDVLPDPAEQEECAPSRAGVALIFISTWTRKHGQTRAGRRHCGHAICSWKEQSRYPHLILSACLHRFVR